MALDAVGSTIYVNQQMASVASEHNARMGRDEMQHVAAGIAMSQEEKEVIEVRPAEENKEIDEDREQVDAVVLKVGGDLAVREHRVHRLRRDRQCSR